MFEVTFYSGRKLPDSCQFAFGYEAAIVHRMESKLIHCTFVLHC